MYIKRHMELVVKDCIKQFPVLLITGPRQCFVPFSYY